MSPTQTTLVQVLPLAKDLDENKVTPGVLGFIVFAVIGLAVWLLMKSMNKHMKRVDFEEQSPAGGSAPLGGSGAASAVQTEAGAGTAGASRDADAAPKAEAAGDGAAASTPAASSKPAQG